MSKVNVYDVILITVGVIVFGLPLCLLIPEFSVWDVVPKFRVTHFPIISGCTSWSSVNSTLLTAIALFFCLYLEVRKRRLDDMVANVLTVRQATDVTLSVERERLTAAVKTCVELLDASTEHYENLVLLRDELRKREKEKKQKPPAIELSSSELEY